MPSGMLRHTPFLNWSGCRSRRLRSLFHNHPAEPPKKGVDVRGPAFPYSAIKFNRDSVPTSFAASSVKDDFNSSVTGKTLSHRLERPQLLRATIKRYFFDLTSALAVMRSRIYTPCGSSFHLLE